MTSMRDPLVGHALEGRYEITERVARGGMATVYLATDLRLTRTVAVKVMHVGLGDDEDFTRKFDREARAAAKLSHPNVVSVFDQGVDRSGSADINGRPYIVMEYVEGRTLRSLMRSEHIGPSRGGMDPIRALTLMEAVLCALAAAHECGLVHRDIKPENVLISDRNHQVKVADFGLAKAVTAQTSTATAGLLIGTVSYLPPELVTTGKATLRSDVYSAGVVLYELLTGHKPHTGDTPIQVAYAHVHNDVPAPSELAPDIPDYLDALVQHATARDPYDRPADARVMLHELRAVRAKLRSGATADSELTEVLSTGSAAVSEWDESTGIRVRRSYVPADYNPRTHLSPTRPTPASPASPTGWTAVAPPPSSELAVRGPSTPDDWATPDDWSPSDDDTDTAAVATTRTRRHRRQARRRRRGLVVLLLVLLLTAGAAVGGWWFVTTRPIATPTVANLTEDAATAQLTAARFSVTVGEPEYSETVPTGRVIRTEPRAGTELPPGSEVTLVLSKGPERYAVPKLVGENLTDVKAALTAAHLELGKVTEVWDEKVAKGVVLKASAEEGARVRPGTTVDLTVSKGKEPITVPDWTGKSAAEAKKALEKLGFTVKVSEKHHDSVDKGAVISQDPAKGTLHRGDTVSLVESLGPVMVTVPNVRYMKIDEAEATLKKAGFAVERKALISATPLGLVSYTDPGGGKQARKGSTVTIFYV